GDYQAVMRDTLGRFPKGVTGNAGGRPKAELHIRELAREHTEQAIRALVEIMTGEDKHAPAIARVAAAEAILDRAWGKPVQMVGGPDEGPMKIEIDNSAELFRCRIARLVARVHSDGGNGGPPALGPG